MNTVAMTLPKAGLGTGVVRIVAAVVAMARWLGTGLPAAVPAGVGLVHAARFTVDQPTTVPFAQALVVGLVVGVVVG